MGDTVVKSRFEQFSVVISGVYRYMQKIERDEMEKYGFKGSFAQYLAALHRYPEGLTASRLCAICDKDKAAISRVVAEMSEKGLVRREGSVYRAKVMLTGEGKRAAEFVSQRARVAVERIGRDVTEENRTIFYEVLEKFAENLEKASKEGLPE